MTDYTVPTSTRATLPDYVQVTGLDGREYIFRFQWSQRAGLWVMSLSDQDGNPIVTGIPVVESWPLTLGVIDTRLPRGAFMSVDSTGTHRPAGLTELGARVSLLFLGD